MELPMSIYHLSVKVVSRSRGRSATGAVAYRAGERIQDERTGIVHDYRRRRGVLHTELVLPLGVAMTREELWNGAERSWRRPEKTARRPGSMRSHCQRSCPQSSGSSSPWYLATG